MWKPFTLVVVLLFSAAGPAGARDTLDLGSPCAGIEGVFSYSGERMAGSNQHAFGYEPNIGMLLYPSRGVTFDKSIRRYRVVIDQGWPVLELYGRQGPIGRLDMVAQGDTAYCLDDELTILRQYREIAGSVYNYSHHRHRLRKSPTGDLLVETEVTGKYRTTSMTWAREPERYAARFASADKPR